MRKVFKVRGEEFEFTDGTAIWDEEPHVGRRQALLIHMLSDEFKDGDFVVFDVSLPLDNEDAENIIMNEEGERYYMTLNTFLPAKDAIRIEGTNLIVNGKTYMFHHTALKAGSVSRKWDLQTCAEHAQKYHGRYGDGYIVLTPNFNTTRYCDCTYYIAKKESE